MAPAGASRNGQKTGQASADPRAPLGYTWGDYIEALVEEHGSLAAVARKMVERGPAEDPSSVERAIRRLRGRGQQDGGLIGTRLLRIFGVPIAVEERVRWMGLYHSPFGDLPVQLCLDQLRLWDRPPISESKARIWILLGLASVALRRRAFDDARRMLESAATVLSYPAARIEHAFAMGYLVSRLEADLGRAEEAARPHLALARETLEAAFAELAPADAACFQARLVDHDAFVANRRGEHERALSLYRS